MRAILFGLVLMGCSGVIEPVDAGLGDGAPVCTDLSIYNGSADRMGCPEATECPACPVLINSGFDCASLARALEACPVDAGAP